MNDTNMKITFIQTGGTIDKDYKETENHHGYNFEIALPAVKTILEKIKPNFNFEIISIVKKDSLDLTNEDRENILNQCQNINGSKIIITHGTDTFKKTAEKLSVIKNKTIILTGAMKPEKFKDSDAEFNIGVTVGAVNILPNGIYIAMCGVVYKWEEYQQN